MFAGAINFNQKIGGWDVSSGTTFVRITFAIAILLFDEIQILTPLSIILL